MDSAFVQNIYYWTFCQIGVFSRGGPVAIEDPA
jgi:hypothetical protein